MQTERKVVLYYPTILPLLVEEKDVSPLFSWLEEREDEFQFFLPQNEVERVYAYGRRRRRASFALPLPL